MDGRKLIASLKPNSASLGYALFLALNAAGIWGGVFPFLPFDIQTPDLMLMFFLAQALTFTGGFAFSTLGVYFAPGPTRHFIIMLAAVPYLLGWFCLIAAMYLPSSAMTLAVVGGAFLGLGAAGFYMLWQRLFASQEADQGNRELIVGTIWGSVIYFALYLIPLAITSFLIPLAFTPLFCLAIVLKSREIDLAQPMFQDVPREHPRIYQRIMKDYWRSALYLGTLAFCSGITRSLALGNVEVGGILNIASMAGAMLLSIGLLIAWQFKNIRIDLSTAYKIVFPFAITGIVIMPVAGMDFLTLFSSITYATYSCALALLMIQCAQISRDQGINPVFIYGFMGAIVYLMHDLGFVGGIYVESFDPMGLDSLPTVAVFSLYILGLTYFVGQGGFRQVTDSGRTISNRIEMVALNVPEKKPGKIVDARPEPRITRERPTNKSTGVQFRDRISKQCTALQQHYRLSAREAEVMELIVRGNSVARIADELIISENTIRTHSKRIYAKLDVHKKQELLDLIDSFDPADLKTTD